MTQRPTLAEIEAARTPAGGWTRETLALWGVSWPPQKGRKRQLATPSARTAPSPGEGNGISLKFMRKPLLCVACLCHNGPKYVPNPNVENIHPK